jgi:hypothetical protein
MDRRVYRTFMLPPGFRFTLVLLGSCLPFGTLEAQTPVAPPGAPASAARSWSTMEGKAFPATFVSLQDTMVILRLPGGQLARIPLLRLSLTDQVYIKNSLPPAAPVPPAPGATPGPARPPAIASIPPPAKRVWPTKVEVDSRAIEVKTVTEASAEQKYVYRSEAFEFSSEDKLAGSVMKEIARTFEATRALVGALPWGVDPKPPADLGFYQAKFYMTRDSYIAAGGPVNSGGVYFSRDRIFRVPFPSLGLEMRGKTWFKDENYHNDTIVHEITHQMMHDYLPFLPIWAIEGMAEYTKIMPYRAGVFHTDLRERGIKDYIKTAASRGVTPGSIGSVMDHLHMTTQAWHERADNGGPEQHKLYFASCLLVYYFSHLDENGDGAHFLKYLDKIREARDAWDTFFKDPRVVHHPDGSASWPGDLPSPSQKMKDTYGLEQLPILLDGRDAAQIQKAVEDGYKKIGVRW